MKFGYLVFGSPEKTREREIPVCRQAGTKGVSQGQNWLFYGITKRACLS
ncbi:MAG: hypothetical protein KKE55_04570 [Candidatus Omnitrophica bacterium]|nr:hypothetical protein [Candidatus Omnitrophota bacterium]